MAVRTARAQTATLAAEKCSLNFKLSYVMRV